MSAGRLLVVLAHPDDESFIFGGTLARYALKGAHITLVCATRGEMGRRLGTPPIATRETLPILRERELREACKALGIADLHLLGLRDKTVDYYAPRELADRITPYMTQGQPDVVITFHEKLGGHPDHCAIGRAATLAHRLAGGHSRLYFTLWSDFRDRLAEVRESTDRVTAIAVDREAARRKMLAFRAHRTQSELMDWLRDDKESLRRLTGQEYFLQGSGPTRKGETDLLS
jgi:N-acetylglucosamine malate deacetylase 2